MKAGRIIVHDLIAAVSKGLRYAYIFLSLSASLTIPYSSVSETRGFL